MRYTHSMAVVLLAGLMLTATTGPGSTTPHATAPTCPGPTGVIDRVVDAATAVVLMENVGRELHLPASVLGPDPTPGTWLCLWPTARPTVDHARTEQRRTALRARQEALLGRSDPGRWTHDSGRTTRDVQRWTKDAGVAYSSPSLAASATAPARLRTPSLS